MSVRRAMAGLALLIASGCSQAPPDRGIITVGIYTSVANLDPRYATDAVSSRAHHLIFNSLLDLDANMRLAPDLAESWESEDYKTYVLQLQKGIRFHDGHELTSDDVVYTFDSILNPASSSPLRGAFRLVDSVKAAGQYTVIFTLKEPSGSFLINLVAVQIVPKGADRNFREHPVGTGPYEFVSHVPDDRIVLRAFRDYFEGLPRNSGIVLKVVPDDIMRGARTAQANGRYRHQRHASRYCVSAAEGRAQLITSPGVELSIPRIQLPRPAAEERPRQARHRLCHRSPGDHRLPPPRSCIARRTACCRPRTGPSNPTCSTSNTTRRRARRTARRGRLSRPGRERPACANDALAEGVEHRIQPPAVRGHSAESPRTSASTSDVRTYEFATLYADILKGNFQMFTLQWAGGATGGSRHTEPRSSTRSQVPPGGIQPRPLQRSRTRSPDRRSDPRNRPGRTPRRGTAKSSSASPSSAPYISLWHETNTVVAQPGLTGIELTPQGDYNFLRNVSR